MDHSEQRRYIAAKADRCAASARAQRRLQGESSYEQADISRHSAVVLEREAERLHTLARDGSAYEVYAEYARDLA